MGTKTKDEKARSAASQWCYCHKCDGVVNETGLKCDKEKMHTCRKWYDGYRTAMIALGREDEKSMFSGDDRAVFHELLDSYLDLPDDEKAKGSRVVQKCEAHMDSLNNGATPIVVRKTHRLFVGAYIETEVI